MHPTSSKVCTLFSTEVQMSHLVWCKHLAQLCNFCSCQLYLQGSRILFQVPSRQQQSQHNIVKNQDTTQLRRRRQFLHTTVTCGMESCNYNTSFYGQQRKTSATVAQHSSHSFHPPHSSTRRLCCTAMRPWKEHGHLQTLHHRKLATKNGGKCHVCMTSKAHNCSTGTVTHPA